MGLICGPNPRRIEARNPLIILTFITRRLKDSAMRSTRADNVERADSIRASPAVPRLVNILRAVGADTTSLDGSFHGPLFPSLIVAAAIKLANARKSGMAMHENEKATSPCIDRIYPIIYSPGRGATRAKTLSQMRNLCSR